MKKNVLINLRVEEELKNQFQTIAEENGYTMSEVLTASMKEMVRRGNVPFNLSSRIAKRKNGILSIQEIKIAVCNVLVAKPWGKYIEKVSIFGSYATGEMTSDSDIDLLIKVSKSFGLFDLNDFRVTLKDVFHKDVDICIENDESAYFNSVVNREKIIIYEKN